MSIKIGFSSSFKKTFKKKTYKNKNLEQKFWINLERFENNPFESSLKTHKLSGKLEGLWSFVVEYDCRVIFKFLEENKVLLIDIGSHDEVY